MKPNIAIIMGGFSSEAAISLKSGQVVFQILRFVYSAMKTVC